MSLPGWIPALLGWAVGPEDRDEVLGDLAEVHRRRREVRGDTVALLLTLAESLHLALLLGARRFRRFTRGVVTATELRLALRVLSRTPLLTLAAVVVLAVGSGMAITAFSVVVGVARPDLGFPGGARWVEVELRTREGSLRPPPAPALMAWEASSEALVHLGRVVVRDAMLGPARGDLEAVRVAWVTPGSFQHLPWLPRAGRTLREDDATPLEPPRVALLSAAAAAARFGRAEDAVGQGILLGGRSLEVVGVLPPEVDFPASADVWLPLPPVAPGTSAESRLDPPALGEGTLLGLLPPDGDPARVEAILASLLSHSDPGASAGTSVEVRRVGTGSSGWMEGSGLVALFLALLAVVAGNLGTLVVARAAARREELAVRAALGASRGRLVGQLTLETALLTTASVALGWTGSRLVLDAVVRSEGRDLPPWLELGLRPETVVFTLALGLGVVLVAGVLPAVRATARAPLPGLQAGAVGGGRAFGPGTDLLVVGQVAVAVGTLGAAALVYQGWTAGFDAGGLPVPAERILTSRVSLPLGGAPASSVRIRLEEEAAREQGVAGVASTAHLPGTDAPRRRWEIEGVGVPPTGEVRVGVGFFSALGIPAVEGRLPAWERSGSQREVVVNRSFVDRHLDGRSPVGLQVRRAGGGADGAVDPWWRIVGVVPDLGLAAVDPHATDGLYLPLEDASSFRLLVVSDGPAPAALGPGLLGAAAQVDPGIVVEGVEVHATVLREVRRVYLGVGTAILALGGLVLLLSLLGLYAILSFEVSRRRREIGVRMALGAGRVRILGPIVRRVAVCGLVGGAAGWALGWLLVRLLQATFVARLPDTASWTFPALAAAMVLTGIVAAWTPARRVLAVPPGEALRAE